MTRPWPRAPKIYKLISIFKIFLGYIFQNQKHCKLLHFLYFVINSEKNKFGFFRGSNSSDVQIDCKIRVDQSRDLQYQYDINSLSNEIESKSTTYRM